MKDTKCPYCGGKVLFSKTSDIIYGKNYSAIYYCEHYPKCDAYVGTHKGTTKSLGRLANKELREKRKMHIITLIIFGELKENEDLEMQEI